jgi:hypothetical protein
MSEKRFRFVNEKDVVDTRENNVPANTKKHTLWSANCYGKWAEARETEFRDFEAEDARFQTIPKLSEITVDEMNYWLSRFALEVRKRDGTNYRHEVLYSLFCGLNREIKEKHPALSLFHSTELKPFQKTLDGRLKELQASQRPFKKQSDALSVNDEMTMWSKGILGTHSPESVVNTLLFLSAKLFVLRGGHELRSLSHDQIQFEEKQDGSTCVTYKEKVSKTNQGGLKRRKVEQKVVQHLEDPLDEKSFAFIYHFYVNKWCV